jgi:DNA (cytosine-5)-methyltransferase 1
MLNTSESPSGAVASSLSDVLEIRADLSKYYLSPRAATGIIRRAAKRGRELPPQLAEALSRLSRAEDDAATA